MVDQTVTQSVPPSVGLLGTLAVVAFAAIGIWGFIDGVLLETGGEYVASTIAVLVVTVVVVAALIALGARSRRWLKGSYW